MGAPLIQRIRPATGSGGQNHDRRELPSIRDGFLTLRQVMDRLRASIWRSHRFGARYPARIDGYPQIIPVIWLRPIGDKNASQLFLIDDPILQTRIQARPLALKVGRQRQFRERSGTIFAQKDIDQIEQGIIGFSQAGINP